MEKRKNRPSKNLILRICIFSFIVYAAVSLVEMQVEIISRRQMLETMRTSIEAQRIINKDLLRQLDDVMDEETVERIARDKLDYVYPDDQVFIDISGS